MARLTLHSTFSIFPDGAPGLGLLLLRLIAGAALVISGAFQFTGWPEPRVLTLTLAALSVLCGLLLGFGLFNWLGCSLCVLISSATALSYATVPLVNVTATKISAAFTTGIAVALLCLGPGAYSLDARRHGRREIIIPTRPRSSDSNSL